MEHASTTKASLFQLSIFHFVKLATILLIVRFVIRAFTRDKVIVIRFLFIAKIIIL